MKFKNAMIGLTALAAVAFLSAAVHSQVSAPQMGTGTIRPTADLIQVVPGGQPSAQSIYATPAALNATSGYYKSVPTSGFNYQVTANVTRVAFNPAGTLAVGYVSLPTAPNDGMRSCVFSTQIVTALYICASSTGTGNCVTTGINSALAGTLSANTQVCYLYSKSNASWDRS